jgi:hypothetical protein
MTLSVVLAVADHSMTITCGPCEYDPERARCLRSGHEYFKNAEMPVDHVLTSCDAPYAFPATLHFECGDSCPDGCLLRLDQRDGQSQSTCSDHPTGRRVIEYLNSAYDTLMLSEDSMDVARDWCGCRSSGKAIFKGLAYTLSGCAALGLSWELWRGWRLG